MPTSGCVLFGDTFTEEVSKRIKADQALGEIQKLVRQPKPTSTTSQRPFRPKGFTFRRGRDQKPYDSISSHRYGSMRQQAYNYFRHGQTSNFRASGFRSPPSRQHNRSLPGPAAGRPASAPPPDSVMGPVTQLQSPPGPPLGLQTLMPWRWPRHCPPPSAGRISRAWENWQDLGMDEWVMRAVRDGFCIPMLRPPNQHHAPHQPCLTQEEQDALYDELLKLKEAGGIERTPSGRPGFLSPHFVVPKSGGRWRLVFNLKTLNSFVDSQHFKMETLAVLPDLVSSHWWMAKIDLKDAFHSVTVHSNSRQHLCSLWDREVWRYTCLPFGLSESPRAFTKVLRPIAAYLRGMGMVLVICLDDWLLAAPTKSLASQQIQVVAALLERLGFRVNWEKSVMEPAQVLTFLGIEVDLVQMEFHLPMDKLSKISSKCARFLSKGNASVPELRSLVGKMVAARPAVHLAMLHVPGLQFTLNSALSDGQELSLLDDWCCDDLNWWRQCAHNHNALPILQDPPSITARTPPIRAGGGGGRRPEPAKPGDHGCPPRPTVTSTGKSSWRCG